VSGAQQVGPTVRSTTSVLNTRHPRINAAASRAEGYMLINPAIAIGAMLPEQKFAWTPSDVFRYHLALGAGTDLTDPNELAMSWSGSCGYCRRSA
jgi:hypothetical protein